MSLRHGRIQQDALVITLDTSLIVAKLVVDSTQQQQQVGAGRLALADLQRKTYPIKVACCTAESPTSIQCKDSVHKSPRYVLQAYILK